MKRHLITILSSCIFLCSIGAIAQAQTDAPPPPPATARTSSSHSGGPFGVGGIAYLTGINGLSLVYDPGVWHIDTLLGLGGGGGGDNVIDLGGRFWFHVAQASSADLSVGGGLLYEHRNPAGPPAAVNNLFIEIGGLIRVFLTSNVALSTGAGLVLGTVDADGYSLGNPNLTGNAALHYFF